jgi:hypothetical protein
MYSPRLLTRAGDIQSILANPRAPKMHYLSDFYSPPELLLDTSYERYIVVARSSWA